MAYDKRNETLNFSGSAEGIFPKLFYASDFLNNNWSIQHFLLLQIIQNQQMVLKAAKKKKEKMETPRLRGR